MESISTKYGEASRIWVMHRGMVSDENIDFLKESSQRYILGTPESQLRRFEQKVFEEIAQIQMVHVVPPTHLELHEM